MDNRDMDYKLKELLETVYQDPSPENLGVLADHLEDIGNPRTKLVRNLHVFEYPTEILEERRFVLTGNFDVWKGKTFSYSEACVEIRRFLSLLLAESSWWDPNWFFDY